MNNFYYKPEAFGLSLLREWENGGDYSFDKLVLFVRLKDREVLIGSIGQKIQSATTIEDALQVAIREIGHALNAERSSVQLNLQAQDDGRK